MGRKKIKFILQVILITILTVVPQVYAKTSIEIKPGGSVVYTNKTISSFFDESMAMKNVGEGLEGANVDVHMSTNMDWAIVAYFSNSAYGTSGEGKNDGVATTINGKEYLSTNGNATGVMDFGKTPTYTSGVLSNYSELVDSEETEEPYDWGKSVILNADNNKYVDLLNTVTRKEMAVTNWYGAIGVINKFQDKPFSQRKGLFGLMAGFHTSPLTPTGEASTSYTFRPSIWN